MKTTIKYVLAYGLWLMAYGLHAQNYEYQWAKSGGGFIDLLTSPPDETIVDIAVDSNNNYYFLAIAHSYFKYDGMDIDTYGNQDILIFATDCNGNFLWHNVIGGSSEDKAYKIGIDDTDGLYVSVNVHNRATLGGLFHPPVHFSPNDSMPLLEIDNWGTLYQEGYKKGFLVKYDKNNGELLWRKAYQGDVLHAKSGMRVGSVFIDSNNIIHLIVGIREGTHLDGTVTVPEGEWVSFLVKYDTSGNVVGTPMVLNMAGFGDGPTLFAFDEQLNRYYLAGIKTGSAWHFGNVPIETPAYILAFDAATGQEIWRKGITNNNSQPISYPIKQIAIDSNSDIYLVGKYYFNVAGNNFDPTYFDDYLLPDSIGSYNSGHLPYTIKLNSNGDIQWVRTPDDYTNDTAHTGVFVNTSVTINGNEVAVTPNSSGHVWGNFSFSRPNNHKTDPVVLRLNKETGEPIGLHDVMAGGYFDEFSVIATDQDGNYVVGGNFTSSAFSNHPNISTLNKFGDFSDIFIARLAATTCGTPVSNEVFHKTQLRLYPNPTNGLVYIEAEENPQSYEVYNIVGQRLMGSNGNVINLQELSNGTYIVKVKMQGGGVSTHKIVKN